MDVRILPLLHLDIPHYLAAKAREAQHVPKTYRYAHHVVSPSSLTTDHENRRTWRSSTEHGESIETEWVSCRHESIVLMPFAIASHLLRKNDLIKRFDLSLRFDSLQELTV